EIAMAVRHELCGAEPRCLVIRHECSVRVPRIVRAKPLFAREALLFLSAAAHIGPRFAHTLCDFTSLHRVSAHTSRSECALRIGGMKRKRCTEVVARRRVRALLRSHHSPCSRARQAAIAVRAKSMATLRACPEGHSRNLDALRLTRLGRERRSVYVY